MPSRKQWILLVFVFAFSGAGVAFVKWYTNRIPLAWVKVIPHDGNVLTGGLSKVSNELKLEAVAGVFYQKQSPTFLLPFQSHLQETLLAQLQRIDSTLVWYDVNPDTLFLRSWSKSYAQMLLSLPDEVKDSLNASSERYNRIRTLAVITKGPKRDSLLAQLGANMDELTLGKYTAMRKRFVQQLLHASNRIMATNPGKRWVFVMDIELFPYVRDAFEKTNRYYFEE